MSAVTDDLLEQAQLGRVAAFRYLAFIDQERRMLLEELYPGIGKGDEYFVPVDPQVTCLLRLSPLARAETVLRAGGIDPYVADDFWAAALLGKRPDAKPGGG
jgi:hypothetical protein